MRGHAATGCTQCRGSHPKPPARIPACLASGIGQSRKDQPPGAYLAQGVHRQPRAPKEGLGLSACQPPVSVPVRLRKPGVCERLRHAFDARLRGAAAAQPRADRVSQQCRAAASRRWWPRRLRCSAGMQAPADITGQSCGRPQVHRQGRKGAGCAWACRAQRHRAWAPVPAAASRPGARCLPRLRTREGRAL